MRTARNNCASRLSLTYSRDSVCTCHPQNSAIERPPSTRRAGPRAVFARLKVVPRASLGLASGPVRGFFHRAKATRSSMFTFTSTKRASGLYDSMAFAIQNKKAVQAVCNGKLRLFCPHVLGRNAFNRWQVLGYQFAGESSSKPIEPPGSPANWRCMALEGLSDLRVLPDLPWYTAPDHSRPQTCVRFIELEISY
jgi:hypothetical protein